MGLIPQVTCRRCGTKFSGMRHRCPACGTRRVKSSSRAPGTTPSAVKGTPANKAANENRKWQLVFGAILIAAIIIALIVMISFSLKNADNPNASVMPTTPPEVSAVSDPHADSHADADSHAGDYGASDLLQRRTSDRVHVPRRRIRLAHRLAFSADCCSRLPVVDKRRRRCHCFRGRHRQGRCSRHRDAYPHLLR